MSFLVKKKLKVQAIATTLENGREILEKYASKFRLGTHYDQEFAFDILVRVEPALEPAFEARMKAGYSTIFLLLPGVRVQVVYDPADKKQVVIDDDPQAILARNPQLSKKD